MVLAIRGSAVATPGVSEAAALVSIGGVSCPFTGIGEFSPNLTVFRTTRVSAENYSFREASPT